MMSIMSGHHRPPCGKHPSASVATQTSMRAQDYAHTRARHRREARMRSPLHRPGIRTSAPYRLLQPLYAAPLASLIAHRAKYPAFSLKGINFERPRAHSHAVRTSTPPAVPDELASAVLPQCPHRNFKFATRTARRGYTSGSS